RRTSLQNPALTLLKKNRLRPEPATISALGAIPPTKHTAALSKQPFPTMKQAKNPQKNSPNKPAKPGFNPAQKKPATP
ncbi:hypothetical protein B1A91_12450, partial [Neisseria meningitidis]